MSHDEENKRIFLVCRSKNCPEAKITRTRCTISMSKMIGGVEEWSLNNRKLCLRFSTPVIVAQVVTPVWVVSPDKPGRKKILENQKNDEAEFLVNNPDFLEV
jgi:hypothetical protein